MTRPSRPNAGAGDSDGGSSGWPVSVIAPDAAQWSTEHRSAMSHYRRCEPPLRGSQHATPAAWAVREGACLVHIRPAITGPATAAELFSFRENSILNHVRQA